jgi:hypothetical protein
MAWRAPVRWFSCGRNSESICVAFAVFTVFTILSMARTWEPASLAATGVWHARPALTALSTPSLDAQRHQCSATPSTHAPLPISPLLASTTHPPAPQDQPPLCHRTRLLALLAAPSARPDSPPTSCLGRRPPSSKARHRTMPRCRHDVLCPTLHPSCRQAHPIHVLPFVHDRDW